MKTLLQLLLAQKLISSKCVLFKNNLLQGDTAPLRNQSVHIVMISVCVESNQVYLLFHLISFGANDRFFGTKKSSKDSCLCFSLLTISHFREVALFCICDSNIKIVEILHNFTCSCQADT